MDYKQTVEWLKSYRDMYYRIIEIDRILEGTDSPRYSLEAPGTAPVKTDIEYIQEKVELESAMKEIKSTILALSNERHRIVLTYRYLELFSMRKTVHKMRYEYKYVCTLHNQAIKSIQKIKDMEKSDKISAIMVS